MPKNTNKNEEASAKEILEQGKKTKFWELILEALAESKADIQRKQDGEEISELSAEQYKFRNELFKAKKEFIDKLSRTPDNLISWLGKPENDRKEFDPYEN